MVADHLTFPGGDGLPGLRPRPGEGLGQQHTLVLDRLPGLRDNPLRELCEVGGKLGVGNPIELAAGIGSLAKTLIVDGSIGAALGPVVGLLTGRFPQHRVLLGAIAGAILALAWIAVLLTPFPLTAWQLAPFMIALAVGSATCSVGFDLARTGVPPRAIGTATGMVNIGGYSTSLLAVLLIGIVLDVLAPDGAATLADYRAAFASMGVLVLAVALGLLLTSRPGPDTAGGAAPEHS